MGETFECGPVWAPLAVLPGAPQSPWESASQVRSCRRVNWLIARKVAWPIARSLGIQCFSPYSGVEDPLRVSGVRFGIPVNPVNPKGLKTCLRQLGGDPFGELGVEP